MVPTLHRRSRRAKHSGTPTMLQCLSWTRYFSWERFDTSDTFLWQVMIIVKSQLIYDCEEVNFLKLPIGTFPLNSHSVISVLVSTDKFNTAFNKFKDVTIN